ncbi:MAG: BON domain-containing protein [Abitibacteriaceae bacterium]|nr:BON domain-containing protein [Abditibacteriaceae bacterium]
MRRTRTWGKTLGTGWLGVAILVALAGCNSKDQDLPSANQVAGGVENAATTVKKEAGPAVLKAAKTVEKAAAPLVKVTDETAMTTKVKGAIMADNTVDSSKINVDVKGNEVILRGRVKNAAQRAHVQNIAKHEAPNYKLVDQLQLEGAAVKVVPKKP